MVKLRIIGDDGASLEAEANKLLNNAGMFDRHNPERVYTEKRLSRKIREHEEHLPELSIEDYPVIIPLIFDELDLEPCTIRQRQIIKLKLEGFTGVQIQEKLHISESGLYRELRIIKLKLKERN